MAIVRAFRGPGKMVRSVFSFDVLAEQFELVSVCLQLREPVRNRFEAWAAPCPASCDVGPLGLLPA
jgi:hypothetical protein